MEQNGTFLDNSKYDYWILHKNLVRDEIFTISIKLLISPLILARDNIGPRLNVHT